MMLSKTTNAELDTVYDNRNRLVGFSGSDGNVGFLVGTGAEQLAAQSAALAALGISAVINPIGSANEQDRIIAAMQALAAQGGGNLFLSPINAAGAWQSYALSAAIPLINGVNLIGVKGRPIFSTNAPDLGWSITGGTVLDRGGSGTVLTANNVANPTTLRYAGTNSGTSATVMTDAGAAFVSAKIIGQTLYNLTDGSSGTITGVTGTTITCSGGVSGGTGNTWAAGNSYAVAFLQANYLASAKQAEISCVLQGLVLQNCATAIDAGAANQTGFAFARIQDVQILGATSDAVLLKNFSHLRVDGLQMYNAARAGQIVTAHDYLQPGNSDWNDVYTYLTANPSYGWKMWSDQSAVAAGSSLNYCNFKRLQVNSFNSINNSNAMIKITANKFSPVQGFTFDALDLEGVMTSAVDIDNCNSSSFINTRGAWAGMTQVYKIGAACRWSNIYSDNPNTTINQLDNSSDVFAQGIFADVNKGGSGYIPRGSYGNLTSGGLTLQGSNVYSRGIVVASDTDPYQIRPSSRSTADYASNPYGINWTMRQFTHTNEGNIANVGYDQAGSHMVSNNSNDTFSINDVRAGTEYVIKKTSSNVNTVTISLSAGGTIDGAATYVLALVNKYVRLVMDGTNAQVIANN